MGNRMTITHLLALSPADRIRFLKGIRESLAEFPRKIHLSEDQRRELEAKLDALQKEATAGSRWGFVTAEIIHDA